MKYKLEIIGDNLYFKTTECSFNYAQEKEFINHTSAQIKIEYIDRVIIGRYALYIKLKVPVSGFYDLVIQYIIDKISFSNYIKWFNINGIRIERVYKLPTGEPEYQYIPKSVVDVWLNYNERLFVEEKE